MSQITNRVTQGFVILAALAVVWSFPIEQKTQSLENIASSSLVPESVELPIVWRDLGMKLIESGALDMQKFEILYEKRGGLPAEIRALLTTDYRGKLIMDKNNSHYYLNILWGFGLANQNPILDEGPMKDQKYGGADRFASTGGWQLASGRAMDHYSKYHFVALTEKQQKLVEEVSKNIYRPCCDNSVHFPDCNHGMAMLGLLELIAANGLTESQMYVVALKVNALWFPGTYSTISKYLYIKGLTAQEAGAKELLSKNYSSYSGYSKILKEVPPDPSQGGASCGV